MTTDLCEQNGQRVAVVRSDAVLIWDPQSALDLMMAILYEHNCTRIALNKAAVCEDFFILSKGLAGEILQKFSNYRVRFAIVGDFSKYTSKPLRDFIRESNRGRQIFFVPTISEAVDRLTQA